MNALFHDLTAVQVLLLIVVCTILTLLALIMLQNDSDNFPPDQPT